MACTSVAHANLATCAVRLSNNRLMRARAAAPKQVRAPHCGPISARLRCWLRLTLPWVFSSVA